MSDSDDRNLWVVRRDCVGCRSCEKACARRHGVARMTPPSHLFPVGFPLVCQHCEDPLCVAACISGALCRDPETGRVTQDRDRCVGCWSCMMICPYGAPRRDPANPCVGTKCDRCADFGDLACVSACTTGAFRCGDDEALVDCLSRPEPIGRSLAVIGLCVALPAAGLLVGFQGPKAWLERHGHLVGIMAGVLMGLSLLLPLLGRWLWGRVRRAVWTRLHIVTGVASIALAMAHARGRLGVNVQTLALYLAAAVLLTGVAYRYVRPIGLQLLALLEREAIRAGSAARANTDGDAIWDPARALAARSAESARRWSGLLRRADWVLAVARVFHVAFTITLAGFVLAHLLVMAAIGA